MKETMEEHERENVLDRIEMEGFDYTFLHYSNFTSIKDEKFHILRCAYIKAGEELKKYLESSPE